MILLSGTAIPDLSHLLGVSIPVCQCKLCKVKLNANSYDSLASLGFYRGGGNRCFEVSFLKRCVFRAFVISTDGGGPNFNVEVSNSARRGACVISTDGGGSNFNVEVSNSARRGAKSIVLRRFSDELDGVDRELSSRFTNFDEDPLVDKLRTQLGVIHPIPLPPINRNVLGLFVLFFFGGVVFDKVWTRLKRKKTEAQLGLWRLTPPGFSMFLEKGLQRKESVEWVNMVLGKLWMVYRAGLENWLVGLLQPVIDNIQKPDYVQRVEVKQFSLGDEPLSVRSVERRTSRRVNDLQYQIGLRYTGGARMLLMLTLKFGFIPIVVPVGVRDFDIDGELWVKLRLIPREPWVGAVSWAFVSLPRIKFGLSPFRLFNLMAIPVISVFLTKLLTEDLPKLFVRPKKIILNFQKGQAVGPWPDEIKSADVPEKNKDSVGELSVTLVDARNLSYVLYGKTDPYVVLRLGDQKIRSKKNSQTSVIGPPGEPIWNQDFNMLVRDPQKQKLNIEVVDSLGFADLTIGTGEVDLGTLQDTVPTEKIVVLTRGWNVLRRRNSGEILLRLTYKAYVEDEEEESGKAHVSKILKDEASDSVDVDLTSNQKPKSSARETEKESFMGVLAALLVSEEFLGIVASETGNPKIRDEIASSRTSIPRSQDAAADSISSQVDAGTDADAEGSKGSLLFWLAVITSVAVVIAISVTGSSFLNL